jgi:hypothetical protein
LGISDSCRLSPSSSWRDVVVRRCGRRGKLLTTITFFFFRERDWRVGPEVDLSGPAQAQTALGPKRVGLFADLA